MPRRYVLDAGEDLISLRVLTSHYPLPSSQPLTMPKITAMRSQVRPWGVRVPRTTEAKRKTTARSSRMYLASISSPISPTQIPNRDRHNIRRGVYRLASVSTGKRNGFIEECKAKRHNHR